MRRAIINQLREITLILIGLITTFSIGYSQTVTGSNPTCLTGTNSASYSVSGGSGSPGWVVTGGTIISGSGTNNITVRWDRTAAPTWVRADFSEYVCNWVYPPPYQEEVLVMQQVQFVSQT